MTGRPNSLFADVVAVMVVIAELALIVFVPATSAAP